MACHFKSAAVAVVVESHFLLLVLVVATLGDVGGVKEHCAEVEVVVEFFVSLAYFFWDFGLSVWCELRGEFPAAEARLVVASTGFRTSAEAVEVLADTFAWFVGAYVNPRTNPIGNVLEDEGCALLTVLVDEDAVIARFRGLPGGKFVA